MPNYTENLRLAKPLASEKVAPDDFNGNFDILDAQVGDLNRYKETIKENHQKVESLTTSYTNLSEDVTALHTTIGNIATTLDAINGEVI